MVSVMENKIEHFEPPVLAVFGNPLMDVCIDSPSVEIFEKYNIQLDGQIELKKEEFLSLQQDIAALIETGSKWPGGSAQNTARLFQWLIGSPGYTVLFGAVGTDDNGKFLEEYVSETGVITKFVYHQEYQTGTCLTFINGEKRSLAAHLGAANFCPIDINSSENREILCRTLLIYLEGFFLTHGFSVAEKIVNACHENQNCLAVNLSAPYVCENFTKELVFIIENADVICGNMHEFLSLCKAMNFNAETSSDVAVALQKHIQIVREKKCPLKCERQNCWKKVNGPSFLSETPLIVITNGKEPVVVSKGLIEEPILYDVPEMPKDLVKDSTGAGDAFMAGFLAAGFCDFSIDVCVEWGNRTAALIIQNVGVCTPDSPPSWVQNSK